MSILFNFTPNNNANTCAGKKIKSSMSMFSSILLESIEDNIERFSKCTSENEKIKINSTNIILCISVAEAAINEVISLKANFEDPDSQEFWNEMQTKNARRSIRQKWDIIADHYKREKWSTEKKPFKTFNIIKDLRNELVHYKAKFMSKDEMPTSKVKKLAIELGYHSTVTFIEDDAFSWVNDILSSEDISTLAWSCTSDMKKEIMNMLIWTTEKSSS